MSDQQAFVVVSNFGDAAEVRALAARLTALGFTARNPRAGVVVVDTYVDQLAIFFSRVGADAELSWIEYAVQFA